MGSRHLLWAMTADGTSVLSLVTEARLDDVRDLMLPGDRLYNLLERDDAFDLAEELEGFLANGPVELRRVP